MIRTTIVKALFVETGTYNDISSRPYQSNLEMQTLRSFQEATLGGTSVSSAAISGIAGNFLKPSAQSSGHVDIENGWDRPRLRFMLHVLHEYGDNRTKFTQYVTGYTNHVGVSKLNGEDVVDQNMRLFFNGVNTFRHTPEFTPHGIIDSLTPYESTQIITGPYQPAVGYSGIVTHSMRPQDVFATSGLGVLANEETIDQRVTFAGQYIKKNKRNNASAPSFVANSIRAQLAAQEATKDYTTEISEIMDNARGLDFILDPLVNEDLLLSKLMSHTSLSQGNSVTYGELCRLFPEFDHVTFISTKSPTSQVHMRGSTEHWNGSTMETVTATILSHSVPSVMVDNMLTGISFTATNNTINGQYHIEIQGYKSFMNNVDLTRHIENFKIRLMSEVLTGITNNNMITFDLQMTADILGETFIKISMNGYPAIDYVLPSFCDGLMSPVLTYNRGDLITLSDDINRLADNIQVNTDNQIGVTYGNSYALQGNTQGY